MNRSSALGAVLALCLSSAAWAQVGGKIAWKHDPLEEMLAAAAKDGKPVMAYFRADWCTFCPRLDAGPFADDRVVKESQAFVCVMVDCTERTQLMRARARHRVRGTPTVVLFNTGGQRVDEIIGAAEVDIFLRKLRTAPVAKPVDADPEEKLDQGQWRDTHRVFLRNGNVVDGQLDDFTAEEVMLHYTEKMTIRIEAPDVQRVELITIRPVGAPVKKIDPVTVAPNDPKVGEIVRGGNKLMPEPKTVKEMKERVEEILNRVANAADERKQAFSMEMRTYGVEGARYLIWRLQTLDDQRSQWVVQTLKGMSDFKFDAELKEMLNWPRPDMRAAAARMLGVRGTKDAQSLVTYLLRDPEPEVRAAAATALSNIGDAKAALALADAALDREAFVSMGAVEAAVIVAQRTQTEAALADRWLNIARRAPDDARVRLLEQLIRMAGTKPKGYPNEELERTLVAFMLDDRAVAVRGTAARLLGEGSFRNSAKAIADRVSIESNPNVQTQMCDALALLKDPQSVAPLIEMLLSRSSDVKAAAQRALGHITRQVRLGADYDKWKDWHKSQQ